VPLILWATHVLQWRGQREAKPRGGADPKKTLRNTDCRLQPAYMKSESLVIAGQPNCGEYVPGPCTHRPSRHPSWEHLKAVREVLLKVGLARGAKS
jgi:hypothetical protein